MINSEFQSSMLARILLYAALFLDSFISSLTLSPRKEYFGLFAVYKNYTNQIQCIKGRTKLGSWRRHNFVTQISKQLQNPEGFFF